MGGDGFIIAGDIDKKLLEPRPIRKNIIDRILGRQRYCGPKKSIFGNYLSMDLPLGCLTLIEDEFKNYLKTSIGNPWPATKNIFDYLDLRVLNIYVRGESAKEENFKWSIQLNFSGCAGMGEVSASLASHWANIWYNQNRQQIKIKFFDPYGFYPDERQGGLTNNKFFLPLTKTGYAVYSDEPQEIFIGDGKICSHFEVDAGCLEDYEDGGYSFLSKLENEYLSFVSDKKCKCQLCMPEFESILGL